MIIVIIIMIVKILNGIDLISKGRSTKHRAPMTTCT